MFFPLFPFAPEKLSSRDRFDRPVLRLPAHSLVHTYQIPPAFRDDGGHILYTANHHRASTDLIGSRNCVMMIGLESPRIG